MPPVFVQFRGELLKLFGRRSPYLGFGMALFFELLVSILLRVSSIRTRIVRDLWGAHLAFGEVASGLTVAAHLMGETAGMVGTLALVLVGAEVVAREDGAGTLRQIFSRPVSRFRILLLKLGACFVYAAALSLFIGVSSLAIGLAFEGTGDLFMTATHESVHGVFAFVPGLRRYALANLFLVLSSGCGIVMAFFFSCFRMAPAAAAVVALTLFLTDHIVRVEPQFSQLGPYCLSTRLLTWRQVYNEQIPWERIRRNYAALGWIDAGFLLAAWGVFQRRDLNR